MKSKDGVLLDPNKEPVIAPVGDLRRGDVVYLKSGGYPMTIHHVCRPSFEGTTYAYLIWHNERGDFNSCELDVRLLQRDLP